MTEDAEFFDVEPNTLTITIPAGAASGKGRFSIRTVDNVYNDGPRTAAISGVSGVLQVTGAELAVLEDDVTPTSITLSVDPDAVAENLLTVIPGGDEITVTATLDGDTRLRTDQVVELTVSGDGFEAVNPFAITIPAGMASESGTFTLLPSDDLIHDGGKTLTVSGTIQTSSSADTGESLTVHSVNLSIVDDEPGAHRHHPGGDAPLGRAPGGGWRRRPDYPDGIGGRPLPVCHPPIHPGEYHRSRGVADLPGRDGDSQRLRPALFHPDHSGGRGRSADFLRPGPARR